MITALIIAYFATAIKISQTAFLDEPRLQTIDGHLYIYGAKDKNVSLVISKNGYLNVNGDNLYRVVRDAKQASSAILNLKYTSLTKLEEDFKYFGLQIDQLTQRLNVCESAIGSWQGGPSNGALPFQFQMKINKLERRVKTILKNLAGRECLKDPCLNGGSCFDRYLDYECRCLEGWEGKMCEKDINECGRFAGSDLGCQNGATCINKPGSYECVCAAGWYGLHCTRRSNDCSSGSSNELCGHGTCVTQITGSKGYTCICDQGWKTDGVNAICNVDVDECNVYPCSRNPLVACHNTPGSFICGPCPAGYSGNGFSCSDINECLIQNGGCSVQPLVQCINTDGSSTCGPCPPGYVGDGKTCTFVGKCQADNGGCHSKASCTEVGSNIQCQCLPGYTGNGIGPFGCELIQPGQGRNPCSPNPCAHGGRCQVVDENNFNCTCLYGFTGQTCNKLANACESNPCQNGGTCKTRRGQFFCKCTSLYYGKYCQNERQNCGGTLNADEGEFQFPPANSSSIKYNHNLSCAWNIIVSRSMVINVTFEYFDLEADPECQMDWLQIHDGKSAGDHMIGKFCGRELPNNGTIITTTNYIYIWFLSDYNKSGNGFKLTWKAVLPVCGGTVNASIHGTIRSPGSPGKYPPNRDCLWQVVAPLGKRIVFTFFEIYIESHENCSFDFLEFHEGLTLESPLLAKFCNTTMPEPLTTPGNTALVYFHSDVSHSDKGFQIAFHPVPGHPGCGGIHTSRRGEITPPMLDGRYMGNMDCAWLIKPRNDMRVKIEFTTFRLENDYNCTSDFVEVREGTDVTSPLIGRYCGFTLPPPIESVGNALFVRFYSDGTVQSTGFRLLYKTVCYQVFTSETGVLKSPGYPSEYKSQEECIYIIQQPIGKVIRLEFQDFQFETVHSCFYDYLEIRDGNTESSPLINKYCGENRPPTIVSTHNFLWIKMVTDKDVEMRGFYANYTTVDISCGGIHTNQEGVIRSPSEYGSYPPNRDCRWVISGKPGEIIQLTFTSFKVESHTKCEFDYVEVYDNSSMSRDGQLIGKFCGEAPPPLLTTTENTMTIVFHSDSSFAMEGFTASYRLINASNFCGGKYFTSTGVIKTPNHPKWYPNSKTCIWVISVPYGNKISLSVVNFTLEGSTFNRKQECAYDFLEIRDGGYESSPLIGRYCGIKIPSQFLSQSHMMYLKFKSDDTLSNRGFWLEWDGSLTGCGGTLRSVTGSIISPNYPEPYGANSLCLYKIMVAFGSRVALNIMDLDLENSGVCSSDYIEIFDGSDRLGKSLGRFCSTVNHPASLVSNSNQMTIKFRSDIRNGGKGFFLKYKTDCTTNITGHRGVIESPNFPEKYASGMNCLWTIKAPLGNKINISFSDFNFFSSCRDDYIEVQEGVSEPTNTIGKFCREKNATTISSSLDKVFVKFVSGLNSYGGSFRAEWVVNGCGGTFTKTRGEFKSPNYPNIYPPNTVCEYRIAVDPSLSITLTIDEINLETLLNCFGDSLKVYGGSDSTAPLLATICQKKSDPVKIESSGNEMYVKFTSDSITGGGGFYATYTTKRSSCGGEQKSNEGAITSRNYPKNYNQMDDCLWTIQVQSNHKIQLNFEDFDLASNATCNDTYVKVFDGPTKDYPLILKHCGNFLPATNPIYSTSNFLTVEMRSGSGYTAKGFKANYTMECGAIITVHEPGVISPSDYLRTRYYHENCSWTLVSPLPDGHISLTVSFMDATYGDDCSNSALNVYDGEDHNATLLGVYCGRKTHLPVVSRGNVLFLELSQISYNDIQFWATYSTESSDCGGVLIGDVGSFASPGYPGTYPPNSDCVWLLTQAPGNQMQINFKEFDIKENEHCNEEYIEVRQESASGKLIGVFCGQTVPANLSAENSMWIKFRSDAVGAGNKGFLADYNLVYQNELNGTVGKIANPYYPNPFMHSENVEWRVTVDFGEAVRIAFKEIRLDDFFHVLCLSSVTIYDGYDETAPELLKACGWNLPDPVTSSSNIIYIVFTNAPIHHGSVFLLEWSQVPKPFTTEELSTDTSECNYRIDFESTTNYSVTLTNPDWPEFSAYVECTWILQCVDYDHLTLIINVLSLNDVRDCTHYHLAVYAKSSSDWSEVGKYCFSNDTDQRVSAGNLMKVSLDSFRGAPSLFSATVQRECGNSIKKSNGVIEFDQANYSSRGLPIQSSYCVWDVTVGSGKKIKVTFSKFDFSMPSGQTCTDKYLMLRNGASEDSPLLGQGLYCSFPPEIPLTTSNRLYVKVKTSKQAVKFKMIFEEVSPSCGSRVKLDERFETTTISSPNYPNIPPSKIECVWTFVTNGEHRLQIDFLERFDLSSSTNCEQEYVEVRDGGTLLSEELGRFCFFKPSTQKSTGNMLLVKYYTNATNPKNGFKARVSIARCGGIIRSNRGVLTSPGYPNHYEYDTECRWEIEVYSRYLLKVSFEDLDLPVASKIVEKVHRPLWVQEDVERPWLKWDVKDQNKTNCSSPAVIYMEEPASSELLPTSDRSSNLYSYISVTQILMERLFQKPSSMLRFICNNEEVKPIKSSSNKMVIEFQSGPPSADYVNKEVRGFKLNFTIAEKGCVNTLNTASGVITSPGYPRTGPNYYHCTWKITVPRGRRVTLRVNDFDLPGNGRDQRVMLYNDHLSRSPIAILRGSDKIEQVYKSSTHKMGIHFWSRTLVMYGKRGFKFTYNSDEPEACGGTLSSSEGFISPPANLSSFFCKWEFQTRRTENQTIAFYVNNASFGNDTGSCSTRYGFGLAIFSKAEPHAFRVDICGNVTSRIIRSPLLHFYLNAVHSPVHGTVDYNVTYKSFACGGVIRNPEAIITTPSYPNNYPPDMDCAWLISLEEGQQINLTFVEFNLNPSCDDYLLVKNGPSPKSPLIGRYCGTSVSDKASITSEESFLFLEFHSDSKNQGKGFKIQIEPTSSVCGGVVHSADYEIMTPHFPFEYENNQECEWEIRSKEGTHIGLVFLDRFHIESSENCEKDFVKVFDYVRGEWKLIKTLCGRELPSPVNSTSNRLKVLFRSNGAVVSDGFKAKWIQNCGGNFTTSVGVITSPGYPDEYLGNLNCQYVIDLGREEIRLDFTFFDLEPAVNGRCRYDRLTLYHSRIFGDYVLGGIYCGPKLPVSRTLRGPIKLEFQTDSNNNFKGFAVNYKTMQCGGFVNESSVISFFTSSDNGFVTSDSCEWEIEAPPEKVIVLRFENVTMPFQKECFYPHIQVWDEVDGQSVLLARVCGHLKANQLAYKSKTNRMKIGLMNLYEKGHGFSASVNFVYGAYADCGGEVTLDSGTKTIKSPDVNNDGFYEDFHDCTWIIRTNPFHQIVANFKSLDLHPCTMFGKTNTTEKCSCDYIELKDGADLLSEVLLHACGTTIPSTVTSSGSVMSLKFSTDGIDYGRGFSVEFSSVLSQCGLGILHSQEITGTLKSPNYPQNYPEGLSCKWKIHGNDTDRPIHIHVVDWDIVESEDCSNDYLVIEDTGNFKPLYLIGDNEVSTNNPEGAADIIRGNQLADYSFNYEFSGKFKLCGQGKSIDFYSKTNEVTVDFFSRSGRTKKGFQLDYSYAGCTRNYTTSQGFIKLKHFKNDSHCYIIIAAPTVNHTISLYFKEFALRSGRENECPNSYLEVRDGSDVKSPIIGKFCGYAEPNPIFSSGQYLWLHIYSVTYSEGRRDYQEVQMSFTTTDQGKGCGGTSFGLFGAISSPNYPNNVRENSVCRWDIIVPTGMEEILDFKVFDIGPSATCSSDYIEFYEVVGDADTERLLSKFCGKDYPAAVRVAAKSVVVKYTRSLHNGGTGWMLNFKALPAGAKIF